MKKKITFVYALIFLISLTFCFSGCQTSKKEIYLFSKGDFNYSEKITFKMGSCTQEKNWELYLRDEARRVKVDEEKLLKAEYIYRVQINLDADILNKTFSDEKMQSFVEETRTLVDAAPQEEKKDVFNRAAIRFLGLTGVVLSDEENCALYKNYLWHFLNNSPVFSEWNMFVEVSESPLVKSVVFDWFDVQNETPKNAEKPYLKEGVEKTYNETLRRTDDTDKAYESVLWEYKAGATAFRFLLGQNKDGVSAEEYLQNAESHAEFPFRWVWEFYPTAFDSTASELTERERQFVSELKELDADDRTICSMTLELLGLEGQFLITQRGNAYFEWMGYDGLFEKLQKMESKNSNLIGLNEIN